MIVGVPMRWEGNGESVLRPSPELVRPRLQHFGMVAATRQVSVTGSRTVRRRCWKASLALGFAPLAVGQHASDNAVIAADDAFGTTIGTETIGLYGPDQVRGFSPQTAGNARIDGLYFDQQAPLSSRVL